MMLSVLLLLLLSSVSLQEADKDSQQTHVSLMDAALEDVPAHRSVPTHQRLPARFKQKRQTSSVDMYDIGRMEWKPWSNSLPAGAVSVYNEHTKRNDYICKNGCHSGFYNPSVGSYCLSAIGEDNSCFGVFEILVNENNFELLEWKDASSGSVPENSVRTCPQTEMYVGKNQYGFGKVNPKTRALHVYVDGSENQYSNYQVLTMSRQVKSHRVTDVNYNLDEAVVIKEPPETMQSSLVKNAGCNSVLQTVTLEKEISQERRWDISSSISLGVTTTLSAGLPGLVEGGLSISTTVSFTFSGGQSVTEGITHSVAVQITAPPNHICKAKMLGFKYKTDLPFTARLHRTYTNGDTRTTTISGIYKGVQMGEAWAEVERCQPIPDAEPCS